jgi:hypothetical protein
MWLFLVFSVPKTLVHGISRQRLWFYGAENGARETAASLLWQEPVGQIGGCRPLRYLGSFAGKVRSGHVTLLTLITNTSGSRSINITMHLSYHVLHYSEASRAA